MNVTNFVPPFFFNWKSSSWLDWKNVLWLLTETEWFCVEHMREIHKINMSFLILIIQCFSWEHLINLSFCHFMATYHLRKHAVFGCNMSINNSCRFNKVKNIKPDIHNWILINITAMSKTWLDQWFVAVCEFESNL